MNYNIRIINPAGEVVKEIALTSEDIYQRDYLNFVLEIFYEELNEGHKITIRRVGK